jgi:hypothetical protein
MARCGEQIWCAAVTEVGKPGVKMNWKTSLWKLATAIVVAVTIFNPETTEFALVVNTLGLDVFFMLLEIQVLVMLGAFAGTTIRPLAACVGQFYKQCILALSDKNIRLHPQGLLFTAPGPAGLMYVLVLSAAMGVALGVN